jgi:hypothetical protein
MWGVTDLGLPVVESAPLSRGYASDELVNLKTFYLMRGGTGFYPSYIEAHAGDRRQLYPVSNGKFVRGSSALFRQPTMFYLWQLVARGGTFDNVIHLALLCCAAVFLGAYWALSGAVGYRALFVGPVLYPGMVMLAAVFNPLLPEFWAMLLLFASFFLLVRGKFVAAGILGLTAVLFRETFGAWLLALVLASLVFSVADRRYLKRAALFAGLLGVGVVAYLVHVAAGSSYVIGSTGSYLANYLLTSASQPLDIKLLSPASYLMFSYGFFTFPTAWLIPFGIAGLWVGLRRAPMARVASVLYVALFVAYFLVIGASGQYWGQAVMPLVLVGCTLFLASIDRLGKRASWTLVLQHASTPDGVLPGKG